LTLARVGVGIGNGRLVSGRSRSTVAPLPVNRQCGSSSQRRNRNVSTRRLCHGQRACEARLRGNFDVSQSGLNSFERLVVNGHGLNLTGLVSTVPFAAASAASRAFT